MVICRLKHVPIRVLRFIFVSVPTWEALGLVLVDVPIDLLNKAFLTVFTSEVFNREMKSDVIFHVATLVLFSIAYFAGKNLFRAASASINDIYPFEESIYVNLAFLLQALKEF